MKAMDIRPTKVEVDLDAITANLSQVRAAHPGRQVSCVIKADAYGHGIIPVAKTLARANVDWLAVALVEEGVLLRQAGVETPILVMGGALEGGYAELFEFDLTPVIFSERHLKGLARAARNRSICYHLKIDTGMGRLGVLPSQLAGFLTRARNERLLHLDGVMTHFANADEHDTTANHRQLGAFRMGVEQIRSMGFSVSHLHASNSAACRSFEDDLCTMMRPGFLIYGINPLDAEDTTLKPALRWTTSPVHIKQVPPGTRVSYGGHWTAARDSVVATLPVGYADGYPRALSNRAEVLIRGQRAPVIGSVCMDMCIVDVTDVESVAMGDEIVLMGAQGNDRITAHELATHANTIPYEIITGVQKRVPRIYTGALAGEIAA